MTLKELIHRLNQIPERWGDVPVVTDMGDRSGEVQWIRLHPLYRMEGSDTGQWTVMLLTYVP